MCVCLWAEGAEREAPPLSLSLPLYRPSLSISLYRPSLSLSPSLYLSIDRPSLSMYVETLCMSVEALCMYVCGGALLALYLHVEAHTQRLYILYVELLWLQARYVSTGAMRRYVSRAPLLLAMYVQPLYCCHAPLSRAAMLGM
jgi:hypothetical protein